MGINMVSKIWVGMSTTDIHIRRFKIQSHLQKRGLWMLVHITHTAKQNKTKQNKIKQNKKQKQKQKQKKKPQKFSLYIFRFAFFSKKNKTKQNKKTKRENKTKTQLNWHPEYLGDYASLDETIRCNSKWFTITQRMQNLDYINLRCVTYAQPIPLPLGTAVRATWCHSGICQSGEMRRSIYTPWQLDTK